MALTSASPTSTPHPAPPAAIAVVAPCAAVHDTVRAVRHQGRECLAVTLPLRTRPLTATDEVPPGHFTHTVSHDSMRCTLAALRAHGVRTVIAGSAQGIDLADRLANELGVPGNAPLTSNLRRDRAAQADALACAGLAAPLHLRATRLASAIRWANFVGLPAYVVAPADTSVAGPARTCGSHSQISLAWHALRRAAHRQTGDRHLVIQEAVPGPHYLLHTVSRAGRHAVQELWCETRTPTAIADRADLVPATGMLARALTLYLHQALDALGVTDGAFRSRIAYPPDRGPVLLATRLDNTATLQAATTPTDSPPRRESPLPTTRVSLTARHDATIAPQVLRAITSLPTVHRIEGDHLYGGAPVARTVNRLTCPGTLVLTGGRSAIEADYRAIRSLEEDLFAGPAR
ncbi:hypothetical protein [Streptomyces sp. NEAU-S7GS2]|uniref:hypothetical protein n=1 Tax=Streptomyces sp. NEAU-S7GS2 TaxID=2202000 RepID=UPI0013A53833|nr:hypothetical protein [Streptomyces sp. NEAU-S7GS2]